MSSPLVERVIEDIANHGKAVFKFISPTDVGLTGGHQYGYYLPKSAWQMFSPNPPKKGENSEHLVKVVWDDGRVTDSCVHWYGTGTRAEYRITRYGRGFPYLDHDCVGSLLVIVIKSLTEFYGYVFDLEEDIEDIQATLGIEIFGVGAFDKNLGTVIEEETPDECMERKFRDFTATLTTFPKGDKFSAQARDTVEGCVKEFLEKPDDDQLMACIHAEYRLFQMVERKVCEPLVVRLFASIDDFLDTAQSILQRRKSRAGRSLENHVETLFKKAAIPFDMRPKIEKSPPDILIPGKKEYLDKSYPVEKLFVIGLKTTCKDRWRQVTREGKRVPDKHLLTLQAGISPNQLDEMEEDRVTLVVPEPLHVKYPPMHRDKILTVASFIDTVRKRLA